MASIPEEFQMRYWEKFLHGKVSKALEKAVQGSGEVISLEAFKSHVDAALTNMAEWQTFYGHSLQVDSVVLCYCLDLKILLFLFHLNDSVIIYKLHG